jgi:hypothetical protein
VKCWVAVAEFEMGKETIGQFFLTQVAFQQFPLLNFNQGLTQCMKQSFKIMFELRYFVSQRDYISQTDET